MEERRYGSMLVCAMPGEDELDMEEIQRIAAHTCNTWQHDRSAAELRRNTIQGKKAEAVLERLLSRYTGVRYVSYDRLRTDGFQKHAPFDGLICSAALPREAFQGAVERINRDVESCGGTFGTVTGETRAFLEETGIFTVEIKSSQLQDPRDYRCMAHKDRKARTEEDYQALCGYIGGFYDYFVYPHYCRDSRTCTCLYEYADYVRAAHPQLAEGTDLAGFLRRLMAVEFDHACDIYTRVFFDVLSDELIVPGYVLKARFFEEPRIRKMPSQKSGNALYYMYPLSGGRDILSLDRDEELLRWDGDGVRAGLFGVRAPACPACGAALNLRKTTRDPDPGKHKFLYLCPRCKPNRWYGMDQIHKNMEKR